MFEKKLAFMQAGAIFGYLILLSFVTVKVQANLYVTENFYFYIIFSQFAYVPVGLCLSFPGFFSNRRNEGTWKWKKRYFFLFLIPSFYILSVPYLIPLGSLFPYPMITNPSVSAVLQVIFGYYLLKGFEKG